MLLNGELSSTASDIYMRKIIWEEADYACCMIFTSA